MILLIRKYGSTFYIGIAMVILPYFGPMEKLKFHFYFQFPLNLTYTNTKVGNMLISEANSLKTGKTGVIHVIKIFTELPCSSSSSSG